jgi:hypothetical protein
MTFDLCTACRNGAADLKGGFMFIHFSWLQYGIAVLAAVAAYYAWVGWRYYRPEISQLFSGQKRDEELWADEVYEPLGRSAMEEGSVVMDAEELDFAEPLDLLGVVPDLLEEIKSLAAMAETKADFLSLFKLIAAKYPQVAGSPQQSAIYGFIREHAPFQLTDSELNQLFQ